MCPEEPEPHLKEGQDRGRNPEPVPERTGGRRSTADGELCILTPWPLGDPASRGTLSTPVGAAEPW